MKLFHLFVIAVLFIRCAENIEVDRDPCKFPPAESAFPDVTTYCKDCYFNLQFLDQNYNFSTSQFGQANIFMLDFDKHILANQFASSFFSFYFVTSPTRDLLYSSRGVKTKLVSTASLQGTNITIPPPSSGSFGVYDYCRQYVESTGDVDVSYNLLTDIELIDSYPVKVGHTEADLKPYIYSRYKCIGEIAAAFVIKGETKLATAQYKIEIAMYERN